MIKIQQLIVLAVIILAASAAFAEKENVFPDEFVNSYLETCQEEGGKQDGQTSNYIMKVCSCTVEVIQKNFTYEEFMEIDRKKQAGLDPLSIPKVKALLEQMLQCRELTAQAG